MTLYNGFGTTWQKIVGSLNGSIVNDFSTAATSGAGIEQIEYEIDLAVSDLIGNLSVASIFQGDLIPPYRLKAASETLRFGTVDETTIEVRTVRNPRSLSSDCIQTLNNCGQCTNNFEDLELFTDWTFDDLTGVLTINGFSTDRLYYVRYAVTQWNLPTLAGWIRNRVCCVLGKALYASGDDSWALVDTYCEMSKTYPKMPGEFIGVPWWRPIAPTIVSIPSRRY
jgi:hypothetical protein